MQVYAKATKSALWKSDFVLQQGSILAVNIMIEQSQGKRFFMWKCSDLIKSSQLTI
jgi:hypothetical protein